MNSDLVTFKLVIHFSFKIFEISFSPSSPLLITKDLNF